MRTILFDLDGTLVDSAPLITHHLAGALRAVGAPVPGPAGLLSLGENLYAETTASGTASVNQPGTNGTGLLSQGYVETSNVNVVEELVNMIQTQRAYEINSKPIQTSDQMLQRLTQL